MSKQKSRPVSIPAAPAIADSALAKSPAASTAPTAAATSAERHVSEAILTACRTCGSTERTKYENRREMAFGVERDGRQFTHVVWRDTNCAACGQRRTDQSFENRVGSASAEEPAEA